MFIKFSDFIAEQEESKGTYCGVWFNKESQEKIVQMAKDNNVPNIIPMDKMHVTVLYSKKFLPNFVPEGYYKNPIVATPSSVEIWQSQSGSNCLVLKIDAPALVERHNYLMALHDATYDYPEYKTHITLSYDVGDYDITGFAINDVGLVIEREYKEDLNLNWAKDNTDKE